MLSERLPKLLFLNWCTLMKGPVTCVGIGSQTWAPASCFGEELLIGPAGLPSCQVPLSKYHGTPFWMIWGFPEIKGTFLGVPIVRNTVFWRLYWGPPSLGKLPFWGCCI